MGEPAARERIGASGWTVQQQLGRGQYGTAYLVQWAGGDADSVRPLDAAEGDQAVAKVVPLEALPEQDHAGALQEVDLMKKLDHPNIVSLKDNFMTHGNVELVIIMEYCDSGDLRGEVRRRAQEKPISFIPEQQIMAWFVQITQALNYIHQRRILHRDLKSSNIFMTSNASSGYDVRIGDFGISRVLEGTMDAAATVVGTPYYMSPEVCRAEPYSYKSDIWALGCVLYEMCMLRHAFESTSLLGLVYKIVSESYDPIPQQYSNDLSTLLGRILDKSIYNRPRGTELLDFPYVKRFIAGAGGHAPNPQAAQPGAASDLPQRAAPPKTTLGPSRLQRADAQPRHMRVPEASPMPPDAFVPPCGPSHQFGQDDQARRAWSAAPGPSAAAGRPAAKVDLRLQVLFHRVRRGLAMRRHRNWLLDFAEFDKKGDGQLPASDFDCAVTSMALGLSNKEIRDVRLHLQGAAGQLVPVDAFAAVLEPRVSPEVAQVETWGRARMQDLAREAEKAPGASGIVPGAHVRIQGLQSEAGKALNGKDAVVQKWEPSSCRWMVRLEGDVHKSIRGDNLRVVRPATSAGLGSGGAPDTAALYQLLCQDSATAVPESHFLGVVERLLHLSASDLNQLLWLVPKTPEGRIDVPEVLKQCLTGPALDQTVAGPGLPGGLPGNGLPARGMGPSLLRPPTSPPRPGAVPSPRAGQRRPGGSPEPPDLAAVPGAVPSPRAGQRRRPAAGPAVPSGGAAQSTDRVKTEVALLRLALRLKAPRGGVPGPGVDVLRLFAAQAGEVKLDELLDAVSVLPLGISRAEMQSIFGHLRAPTPAASSASLPLALLAAAIDAVLRNGLPDEVDVCVDVPPLATALQRLVAAADDGSGRASPQEFRVALMQADPYLTPGQLEWLLLLTDKDGEGRLFPRSLLDRLNAGPANITTCRLSGASSWVPPWPTAAQYSAVGEHLPQALIVAVLGARVQNQLHNADPSLTLERVLGLFDVAAAGDREAVVSPDTLASILGHLGLGLSTAEGDALVKALMAEPSVAGSGRSVRLCGFYEALSQSGSPDMQALLEELRAEARQKLLGRGASLAEEIGVESGDAIPEDEFRSSLSAALADEDMPFAEYTDEEEDRLVLLAEKDAAGEIRWRRFAQEYAGWVDANMSYDSIGDLSPKAPKGMAGTASSGFGGTGTSAMAGTGKTWRSGKGAAVTPVREVVSPSPDKSQAKVVKVRQEEEQAPSQGACRCLSRLFGGSKAASSQAPG